MNVAVAASRPAVFSLTVILDYARISNVRIASLERTRILCMYIKNEIFKSGIQPMRVLHFAPVKGLKDFLKNSPYVSTYIDADLNPNVATYQADMTRMPYEDNSFDLLSVPIFYIVSQKTERLCRKYIGYCVRGERP